MKLFIILMAFSSSTFAAADLYRCDVNGKVLYSDSPCEDFGGSQVKRFRGQEPVRPVPSSGLSEGVKDAFWSAPGKLLDGRHDLPWFFGLEDDCKRIARKYKASDSASEKQIWLDRFVAKGCVKQAR